MIHSKNTLRDRSRIDIKEVRRKNLEALIEQLGTSKALAEKLGYKNPSYISQMLTGRSPIGDRTAKRIEQTLGLEDGWMSSITESDYASHDLSELDQPGETDESSNDASNDPLKLQKQAVAHMSTESIVMLMQHMLRILSARNSP